MLVSSKCLKVAALSSSIAFLSALPAPHIARGQGVVHSTTGDASDALLGWSVTCVGDVDGDGHDDFATGAIVAEYALPWIPGYVRVISGKTGSLLLHSSLSNEPDFGYSLAAGGDVNNDGSLDLLVGAIPTGATSPGRAFAISIDTGAFIHSLTGPSIDDSFGHSIHGVGDVNADGHDDFVVGSPRDDPNGAESGSAILFSGQDATTLRHFKGDAASDFFGFAVCAIDDANTDGVREIAVGAYLDDNTGDASGSVRVFSGASGLELYTLNGDGSGDLFGQALGGGGDVNDDGKGDLAIGAPGADTTGTRAGLVRVVSGSDGATLISLDGEESGDELGTAVDLLGDVNADGHSEVIAGAPFSSSAGDGAGKAYVFDGDSGTELYTFVGTSSFDNLGYSVSAAGDLNADGFADGVIGIPYADSGPSDNGLAIAFSGTCGNIAQYGSGCVGSGEVTPLLSAAGCSAPGTDVTLDISGGLGGAPGLILVGDTSASLPLGGGCTLLLFPIHQIHGIGLSGSGAGNGTFTTTTTIPSPTPPVTLYLQVIVFDPQGFKGYSTTNGLLLTIQ